MSLEPKFHFFEDCLPDDDHRSHASIYCNDCARLIHAAHNEVMGAWFDTGIGEICLDCFHTRYNILPSIGEAWSFEELEAKP